MYLAYNTVLLLLGQAPALSYLNCNSALNFTLPCTHPSIINLSGLLYSFIRFMASFSSILLAKDSLLTTHKLDQNSVFETNFGG